MFHRVSSPTEGDGYDSDVSQSEESDSGKPTNSPLPWRQLAILAVISLAEQTALNSISPYLPEMAATFPEVDATKIGLFVGIIASSFAGAQFATNVFWGRLSDRVGRKPIILLGTFLTAICLVAFGFCRTLWQAVVVQAAMGFVNGNAGVVSTILGEITDKSNQSSAFAYLPLVYGIGGITGPLIGGLLVQPSSTGLFARYPYLLPNLVSAAVLFLDLGLSIFFLDESLQEAQDLPPLGRRIHSLFTWLWQFSTSYRPSYLRGVFTDPAHDDELEHEHQMLADNCPAMFPEAHESVPYRVILIPQIVLLMLTYFIFSLCNIAFNSLYPIFASTPRPTGRELSPRGIGLSLSFAGAVAILFQAFLFTAVQRRLGNRGLYRVALLIFVVAFLSMPLVGRHESTTTPGKAKLWAEIGVILLWKTVAAVGGLTCAMLMITNSSPKPSTLGTLNGLAQTLGALGRAVAPLLSGALFTASTEYGKNGEFLAWGVFACIAAIGLAFSFGLHGKKALKDDEDEPLLYGEAENDAEGPMGERQEQR